MTVQDRTLDDRYHLDDVLGVGGMSTVWRAHDRVLGRDVAVKLLSGRLAADTASRQRIRIEARAAAALAHPNVAQVYDFGEAVEHGQRTPYVVMELVPGPTLAERAATPLAPPEVFRICAEIAAGLAAAHADGLVHRDVKPANVILAPTGAKVVDFGIAAVTGTGDFDDELLGTPDYLAPERLTGDSVTPASDVYSLGVLLYRLLAGHLPWPATGATDLLEAHLNTPPAPLPELADVPPDIAALVARCLSKSPAERPSAADVATTLAAAAGVRPATPPAATALTATPAITTPARRHRRYAVAALAAVAAAAVATPVAWSLIPDTPSQEPAAAAPAPSTSASASTAPSTQALPPPTAGPIRATGTATGSSTPPPPGSPAPTTASIAAPLSPAPTEAAPPPQTRTFTSQAGTVEATCTAAGQAHLGSYAAIAPWRVDWVNRGPATAVTAAFAHGNQTVDMTVTCQGPAPVETTTTHTR
ncbi:serine/threonine-protein kinase [Dactylosporangium sp. NPDC051541]|uniref:serine/threonine-protein kinase n=1 Tax=Dactylosporangium sp. NPDC051541 TaxID=3363977 RepID=UPI00378DA303